jgi:hypothetical protein
MRAEDKCRSQTGRNRSDVIGCRSVAGTADGRGGENAVTRGLNHDEPGQPPSISPHNGEIDNRLTRIFFNSIEMRSDGTP